MTHVGQAEWFRPASETTLPLQASHATQRPGITASEVATLSMGDQLAELLSQFARTMLTDFQIQTILDQLVNRIVRILPISAAGVTLIQPGDAPQYIAASDESALLFEKLQTELDDGPCIYAYQSGTAVASPDLRTETRFAKFGPRAMEAGLAGVFTFPLRHGTAQLGALDLYRDEPGMLSPEAMRAAQTLADVVAAYLLNAQARVDLEEATERAREASMHDHLTGLPNRPLLLERLSQAFARSRRNNTLSAVLFVDLDDFKSVNDQHGHSVGDEVLIGVSARLKRMLRPADTVARLHGDEFVILCEELHNPDEATAILRRLTAAMSEPFDISSGISIQITASIGIAFADRDDHSPVQVLRDADAAMYEAKRSSGGRHRSFSDQDGSTTVL